MRLPAPLHRAALRAMAADGESYRTLARLRAVREHTGEGEEAEVRVRALGGHPVVVREATADADTIWDVFARHYHRPPRAVERRGVALVWDLGANIGLTMADLATRLPDARIVGVELDEGNAALARRNLAPWAERTELIEAAAWPDDGETWYHRWPGATSAYHVHAPVAGEDAQEGPVVATLSLGTLLERTGGPVDYVKMDVEGAESELLTRNTGWAEQVGCLKVEVHGDYTTGDCTADLERLGFAARRDRRHGAAVVGIRPQ